MWGRSPPVMVFRGAIGVIATQDSFLELEYFKIFVILQNWYLSKNGHQLLKLINSTPIGNFG